MANPPRYLAPNRLLELSMHRGAITAAVLGAIALAVPSARAAEPDRAHRTPVAHGAASAKTAVAGPKLRAGLRKLFRRVGKSGAFVIDANSGQVLFSRKGGRERPLASNTKIFTTATALTRFEPGTRLETTVWSGDDVADGVSQALYLRGGGDPTLTGSGLSKLASRVRAAGVTFVQGPLRYDDTFLDRATTIPQHGIRAERIGTLSALTIDGGGPRDPARDAARRFLDALKNAGVSVGNSLTSAAVPFAPPAVPVAGLGSPTIAELSRSINVPSNNFMAEMLLKDTGGQFGPSGSTAGGIGVIKQLGAERGFSFRGENGSGLSRRNRASPASVARLLDSMIEVDETASDDEQLEQRQLREAFVGSLAVAGKSGTLARRMRGTAAKGNCFAKTGTLNRV
ncbi:MAG TPA: D-alanyl-D-alanine carboxypeptidase, partial [Solirubrobacterales bacterium]|nr:D-alanyl-D-alanine carboxypeptidase [Solirubrobacterales bacterium]